MTSSNGLKSAVSNCGTQAISHLLTVAPRKPFHLNFSLSGRLTPKSLMYGSLTVQPIVEATTSKCGGGRYDQERIQTFQSSKIQSGCKDSNGEDRFSLQIQHKLPYNMDSKIQEEAIGG